MDFVALILFSLADMLLQELQQCVEDEQRGRDDARDAASKAERRVGEIASQLEELRSQLEQV